MGFFHKVPEDSPSQPQRESLLKKFHLESWFHRSGIKQRDSSKPQEQRDVLTTEQMVTKFQDAFKRDDFYTLLAADRLQFDLASTRLDRLKELYEDEMERQHYVFNAIQSYCAASAFPKDKVGEVVRHILAAPQKGFANPAEENLRARIRHEYEYRMRAGMHVSVENTNL